MSCSRRARLIRRLSELYGGRPGTLGFIRLARDVLAHLAVTGTIAIGDSFVQQLVGHGLAARASARLGEGVVNGLMTARIGIAAMDVVRPCRFSAGSARASAISSPTWPARAANASTRPRQASDE